MGERWLGTGIPWLSSLAAVTGERGAALGMVGQQVWVQPCLDSFPIPAIADDGRGKEPVCCSSGLTPERE